MSESPSISIAPLDALDQTPLTSHWLAVQPDLQVTPHRGVEIVRAFTGANQELAGLTSTAAVFDLGYRAFVRITGGDRIRWTNGMVTNTIIGLEEGQGNYSFLLNAQGRILGDATIYRFSDHLLLETDRSQLQAVLAHLDHFIIMDDVELQPLDASRTAIGIAGPESVEVLARLGLPVPPEQAATQSAIAATWQGEDLLIVHAHSPLVPRYEVHIRGEAAPALWDAFTAAQVAPCGADTIEALRILEGTPLYGVDIRERHLPQETAQTRALNFSKGCYLGQEIVERIRSRATVHRTFQQFIVAGPAPSLAPGQTLPLEAEGAQQNPVGELSSVAAYDLSGFNGTLALGFIRTEVQARKLPVTGAGLAVTAIDAPPEIHALQTRTTED